MLLLFIPLRDVRVCLQAPVGQLPFPCNMGGYNAGAADTWPGAAAFCDVAEVHMGNQCEPLVYQLGRYIIIRDTVNARAQGILTFRVVPTRPLLFPCVLSVSS